jgi:hypothetical protein
MASLTALQASDPSGREERERNASQKGINGKAMVAESIMNDDKRRRKPSGAIRANDSLQRWQVRC